MGARLEMEMMKRRERIEKWRAEKKKKEMDTLGKENEDEVKPKEVKKWSLEEDDEDEDDVDANGVNGDEGDGEIDPLDAYMTEVSKEVRKIKGGLSMKNSRLGIVSKPKSDPSKSETNNGEAPKKKGLVIMTGVAKKKPESKTKKPEVMEQNQDALEYSSEEEKEGLDDLNGKLKEKG